VIRRLAPAAAVVFATLGAQAGTVKIGEVELPADCALAKNERPRLLFRGSDLPKYKERIAGPMKADFEHFKAYWDAEMAKQGYDWKSAEQMDGVCLAVLYRLTGEKRYADAVRSSSCFKQGSTFWAHPFAMDLVFDALSKEEINSQVDLFLKDAPNKYRWGGASVPLWAGLVLHGSGAAREAESDRWLAQGIREARSELEHYDRWAGLRGGDANSFSYIGNHSVIRAAAHLTALSNALGEDAWRGSSWARNICPYYVYHFLPWRNAAIHFDNTTGLQMGPNYGDFGGSFLLYQAPARYRDGRCQWWVDQMLTYEDLKLAGWPKAARHMRVMEGLWGRILWRDPEIPALEPKDFPPSRLFVTRGACMRESWQPDATFVHFRCGIWDDLGDGRHNADQCTFTVYKKGILALDSGAAHSMDSNGLKFKPADDYHNLHYSSETIAHNGILVRHAVDDLAWKALGKLNTGGQVLRREPADWSAKRGVKVDGYNKGRYVAWETSPEYDYVAGDATYAYSPNTVNSLARQMVYVRPDLVFVFDRVETATDGCATTWLLHTADRPRIDGKESPDQRVHPDDHFLWEGSTATITDEEMGGRMFCRMLLPEKREVRLLGGENHEFELSDGRNIGPTPETYAMPKDHDYLRESRAEGEGLRGWRIEVEDGSGSRSIRFLNVFQTCDKGMAKMAPCAPVQKNGMVGAKVESAGATVEVVFLDSGALGGHITIEKGGKELADRALASGIEDNYDRWKSHPDYQKWTTDPFRMSVVLGRNPEGEVKK